MKIKLYHGSNVKINEIDLSRSKPGKDFGKGFYLNPDYSQAMEMAKRTHSILGDGEPIVSCFEFDIEYATRQNIQIKVFDDYCDEWADFIVKNRRNRGNTPFHNYDIVIGPIADDSVGVQIRQFIMGYIPVERLIEELRFNGDRAIQYYFGTEKAINLLKNHE